MGEWLVEWTHTRKTIAVIETNDTEHATQTSDLDRKQKERDFDVVTGTRYALGGGVSTARLDA